MFNGVTSPIQSEVSVGSVDLLASTEVSTREQYEPDVSHSENSSTLSSAPNERANFSMHIHSSLFSISSLHFTHTQDNFENPTLQDVGGSRVDDAMGSRDVIAVESSRGLSPFSGSTSPEPVRTNGSTRHRIVRKRKLNAHGSEETVEKLCSAGDDLVQISIRAKGYVKHYRDGTRTFHSLAPGYSVLVGRPWENENLRVEGSDPDGGSLCWVADHLVSTVFEEPDPESHRYRCSERCSCRAPSLPSSTLDFDWHVGSRIGEAAHPGPPKVYGQKRVRQVEGLLGVQKEPEKFVRRKAKEPKPPKWMPEPCSGKEHVGDRAWTMQPDEYNRFAIKVRKAKQAGEDFTFPTSCKACRDRKRLAKDRVAAAYDVGEGLPVPLDEQPDFTHLAVNPILQLELVDLKEDPRIVGNLARRAPRRNERYVEDGPVVAGVLRGGVEEHKEAEEFPEEEGDLDQLEPPEGVLQLALVLPDPEINVENHNVPPPPPPNPQAVEGGNPEQLAQRPEVVNAPQLGLGAAAVQEVPRILKREGGGGKDAEAKPGQTRTRDVSKRDFVVSFTPEWGADEFGLTAGRSRFFMVLDWENLPDKYRLATVTAWNSRKGGRFNGFGPRWLTRTGKVLTCCPKRIDPSCRFVVSYQVGEAIPGPDYDARPLQHMTVPIKSDGFVRELLVKVTIIKPPKAQCCCMADTASLYPELLSSWTTKATTGPISVGHVPTRLLADHQHLALSCSPGSLRATLNMVLMSLSINMRAADPVMVNSKEVLLAWRYSRNHYGCVVDYPIGDWLWGERV